MSEFEKELEKFNLKNGTDYRTLNQYSDVLKTHFKDWQPPKELVEVPQFVADWFEENMNGTFTGVISSYAFSSLESTEWVKDNGGIDLLCNMKLYGYTVKKEQLYEVIISGFYLVKVNKFRDSKRHVFCSKYDLCNWAETGYKLTEQQIKAIDEQFMSFAVKVEE